jgi:hypothetical protein
MGVPGVSIYPTHFAWGDLRKIDMFQRSVTSSRKSNIGLCYLDFKESAYDYTSLLERKCSLLVHQPACVGRSILTCLPSGFVKHCENSLENLFHVEYWGLNNLFTS